jgi:hypothetical protein
MTTRLGTILPGQKLDPWCDGMEAYLPDNSDVIILRECGYSLKVVSVRDWHENPDDSWYVNKNNVQEKGLHLCSTN